jgi:hypothetical protein
VRLLVSAWFGAAERWPGRTVTWPLKGELRSFHDDRWFTVRPEWQAINDGGCGVTLVVGWIFCPCCRFRRRVCVALEGPPDAHPPLEVMCPVDRSRHLIGLEGFVPVEECPADLAVSRPSDFAPTTNPDHLAGRPRRARWTFW